MAPPAPLRIESSDPVARALTLEMGALRSEIHDVAVELAGVQGAIQQAVTWPKLVAILGGFAGTVIAAAWILVSATADDVRQLRADSAAQMTQVRTDTAERLNRFEAKQDAVLQVVVKGATRNEAQRELARRTKED